jgi:GcrA cell cycle regulator
VRAIDAGRWWSPEDDEYLRANWDKKSASEIGRWLGGRSKNSVVGRAHRLRLPKKIASPTPRKPVKTDARATAQREYERRKREYKKAGEPWRTSERLALAAALPALEALRAIANEPFKHEVEPMPKRPTNPAPPPLRRQPLPPQVPRSASVVLGVLSQCCWPIGEPGTRDFKFCCEPVEAVGKSYCPEHMRIAYVTRQRERVW